MRGSIGSDQNLLGKPAPEDASVKHKKSSDSSSKPEAQVAHSENIAAGGTSVKIKLTQSDAHDALGFSWSARKKWTILSVIFVVQLSMNFNASIYSNAVPGISASFHVSEQAARVGQCVFLICYAFGCELWAPWSEELGRRPILQASLALVNLWQIPAALSPTFGGIVAARALGGLSSAGGSVTLGMVADMWRPADQQYAVAFVVLSSVGGSVLGPVVGGFVQQYLSWRWVFWLQLIFGGAVQVLHFFLVPETRVTVLLDREARRRRDAGQANVYGPNELKGTLWERLTPGELLQIWTRPFAMLLTEPIVLCLSLLSGFSDALIFTFLVGYGPVFAQWGFNAWQLGLAFVPLLVGYVLAYLSFMPFFKRDQKFMAAHGADALIPERRLYWLLYMAPLEAIGLFGFAWTSLGPSHGIPWIAPLLFSALVGIANYAIYMATIDYMVAAYGPYAASAAGGNGFSRDLLAGVAAMYSEPFFRVFPSDTVEWPSTILAIIAIIVTIPIYVFYWNGPAIRARSPFALSLSDDRESGEERPAESAMNHADAGMIFRGEPGTRIKL